MDKPVIDEIKEMFRTKDFEFYRDHWHMTEDEYERYVNFEMTIEEMREIFDRKEKLG